MMRPAAAPVETPPATGEEMHELISALYPICRSITGNGVRQTLAMLRQHVPLTVCEVPTGTAVLDWTIPREWNITDAYVTDPRGSRVVDFQRCNLHVVSYSVPVHRRVSLEELKDHIFTLPEHPEWIPYRTSYYHENWGFCLPHRQLASLDDGEYEVCIDSRLEDGSLTYGELYLEGETRREVLISTHVCHPSLCNDNLSGIAVATFLAKSLLGGQPRRYSYRFLFVPGTIGSIAWLSDHRDEVSRIEHGLVASCLGDRGPFTYKKSRRGNAVIDRAVINVLRSSQHRYEAVEFSPYGYDERQYCSPGFNLPVGCLSRTPHGRYPEYHSSADDLGLVRPECLAESLSVYTAVTCLLEHNETFRSTNPWGEPQLGRRGLYRSFGGPDPVAGHQAMLWVLNLSDGEHSLLDISDRSGLAFDVVRHAAETLREHGLLAAIEV